MLSEAILKKAAEDRVEQPFKHRPSNISPDRCMRQAVYHAREEPVTNPIGDRGYAVFDTGTWEEERSLDYIRSLGMFEVHSEQMEVNIFDFALMGIKSPFAPNDALSGSIDGIITSLINKESWVLEHKAINSFSWDRYHDGTAWPVAYFWQLGMYIIGVNRVDPEITKGILLIKNKNSNAFMEFHLRYNSEYDSLCALNMSTDETWECRAFTAGILLHIGCIDNAVADKVLPARAYTLDDWQCDYCRWRKSCWGEELAISRKPVEVEASEAMIYMAQRARELTEEIKAREVALKSIKADAKIALAGAGATKAVTPEGKPVWAITRGVSTSANRDKWPPELRQAVEAHKTKSEYHYAKLTYKG